MLIMGLVVAQQCLRRARPVGQRKVRPSGTHVPPPWTLGLGCPWSFLPSLPAMKPATPALTVMKSVGKLKIRKAILLVTAG